jgi:hypothetical protein
MKYVKTVEANIWDSSNEAQVDKIVDWLTINAPNLFDFTDDELRIQTEYGIRTVRDSEAIIIDPNKTRPEVMNGRMFKAIHSLLTEED